MQPDEQQFNEWLGHPVTEWVLSCMRKAAEGQKVAWADMVWTSGDCDPQGLTEARVRADCYMAIPDSSLEDWRAIDDSDA